MFHKILVAIDGSEIGQRVFGQAIELAKATQAKLMLLHVLSIEDDDSPSVSMIGFERYPIITGEMAEMHQQQWVAYESRGMEMLQAYAAQASTANVLAEFSQNVGAPGRTICAVARSWQADLIIMGRRGRSGLNELLLGSVSNYVVHHAPCSVLTVQGKPHADLTVTHDQETTIAP